MAFDEAFMALLREQDEESRRWRDALLGAGATEEEASAILEAPRSAGDCGFVGLVPADAVLRHREHQALERMRQRAALRNRMLAGGVPELHLARVFDSEPELGPALDAARAFAKSDAVFLLLLGGVGTRKTGSAVRALADFCDAPHRRPPSMAFVAADKIAKLGALGKTKELESIEECSFLVLDDVGIEYLDAKGWFHSIFEPLINKRYGSMLKTVITSNLDAHQFKATYGERVADRIRELGIIVELAGGSSRRRLQQPTRP